MVTIILKRSAEPTVIQMTQEWIMQELRGLNGSEMLLTDTWKEGLRKVRTPYVCLLEADCVLSVDYLADNVGLMKKLSTGVGPYKGGGYTKLAMIGSSVGVKTFDNRIYNYQIDTDGRKKCPVYPNRVPRSSSLYEVQVAFVPGAIIRMSALGRDLEKLPWDDKNLVKMSAAVSFNFWNTNRRISINPNTIYVSDEEYLSAPPRFDNKLPDHAREIFSKEGI